LIAALLLGLAEIELEFRAERQVVGIEVAKKKGIYKGRRKETTKAVPTRAMQLRERGLTVAEIATALGTNKRAVQRYLKAPARKLLQNDSEIRLKIPWISWFSGTPRIGHGRSFLSFP